jgi:hypothetical protein
MEGSGKGIIRKMDIYEGLKLGNSKTEAGWHNSIQKSFLFIPRAGMRIASDDLIIELYREVFFKDKSEGTIIKRIDPDEVNDDLPAFQPSEKYSLYMSRGRRKQTSQRTAGTFYTPLYPTLARTSWLRKKSERTIKDYFLRAIAQNLHDTGNTTRIENSSFIKLFFDALVGNNGKNDIAGLQFDKLNGCITEEKAKQKLSDLCSQFTEDEKTGKKTKGIFTLQSKKSDTLAETLVQDLTNICELEQDLDRLQWMSLFKTFLRLTTSVWLLAQMKMTIVLRDELLSVLTDRSDLIVDDDWVDNIVINRFVGLFRPTLTPNTQTDKYVQDYVKARNELNILVALVEKYAGHDWKDKTITLHSGSHEDLGVLELLTAGLKAKETLNSELEGVSLDVSLTRFCEKFPAWRQPVAATSGPAKGYREHLLVLRKMAQGDEDGGYLVIPNKQLNSGVIIFPGNLMLKLLTYLAARRTDGRQLIFADVEEHFRKYGIDFGEKGEIRPKLIASMQDMGLLKGSPDAGDSVAVSNPYKSNASKVRN